MSGTALVEAYARLNSLKANLPEHYEVHEKWVAEFNAILDLLETATGHDLGSFRVPTPEVRPRVVAVQMATMRRPGRVSYSTKNYCERSFLVMKIDGVLNYFSYQSTSRERTIGFNPPRD
ncbi:MAG: hypothetical protein WD696_14125 [Bryobacteraceae bacterium]